MGEFYPTITFFFNRITMKKLILSFCFLLIVHMIVSQNFKYRTVPFYFLQIQDSYKLDLFEFTDITSYMPVGYKTDGSIDYTEFIQAGINKNRKVIMPNFPVMLNDNGLDIPSNTTIVFRPKSELLLEGTIKGSYQIIRIHNKQNVNIYNAKITGDRLSHIGNDGEWGMGISIRGSDNIGIFNSVIKKCWGDGIYIGHSKTHSSNITIKGTYIDYNRRNGISIISVDKLLIKNSVFSNTFGTNPQTGIDIEPNYSINKLDNIVFENIVTFNNFKNGVLIHLNKLPGKNSQEANVVFSNYTDLYSTRPVRVSGTFSGDVEKTKPLGGEIKFRKTSFINNKYPKSITSNKMFPKIIFEN